MSREHLSWGILGTGKIAHIFAQGLAKSRTGRLAAVGSRKQATADEFAQQYGAARAYGSYEKLLADPQVQAVYIGTPHPMHAEWCLQAARAKKHILCEKPLTLNHAEAVTVARAARENGVFLMEAFMYRCHPQTARLLELIRSGSIGKVSVIQASFSFKAPFDPQSRLFSNELGGGAILDIGCYTMSISRLVAGAAEGRPFADPLQVAGFVSLMPGVGTDGYAIASVQFPGGILAQLSAGVRLFQGAAVRIFGSEGWIHLPTPYLIAREGGESIIQHFREGMKEPEEIVIRSNEYLYALEADAVGDAIGRGELESPFMTVGDTLGNMAALDAWRCSAGFLYESEKRLRR